jgi:hypothetical protein
LTDPHVSQDGEPPLEVGHKVVVVLVGRGQVAVLVTSDERGRLILDRLVDRRAGPVVPIGGRRVQRWCGAARASPGACHVTSRRSAPVRSARATNAPAEPKIAMTRTQAMTTVQRHGLCATFGFVGGAGQ